MHKYIKNKTVADQLRSRTQAEKIELNLKITDFAKQSMVPIEHIVAQINRVPQFHLNKLTEIVYDPERFTPKILSDNPYDQSNAAKGVYIQSHRMIALFDFTDREELLHIIFHELGHHVYFIVIKQKLKMQWLYDICKNDKHVSEYASRNAAEDFAESYAAFLLQPEKLKKIPLKYNFMLNHIFEDQGNIIQSDKLDFRA